MGTRNLTCVFIDGDYKVAQYGQWDGYPAGQGLTILGFLRSVNLDEFKQKVRQLKWTTGEELSAIQKEHDAGRIVWHEKYPELSRDAGGKILQMLMDKDPAELKLKNEISFAEDSLFCEWAYVVDLDKETLEVYEGYNKIPLSAAERFYNPPGKDKDGYYPVNLAQTFHLNILPTDDAFLEAFQKDEV